MKIAAITMVYRDHWALSQWYTHYSRHFGPENLYVVSHGADPEIQRRCPGASVITIPRDKLDDFDLARGRMLNAFQAGLDQIYDWVVRTDVDELICLDPAHYSSFADALSPRRLPNAVFALGLNVAEQNGDPDLGPGMSALAHRRRALFSSHYSKAWAVRRRAGMRLHGAEVRPRFVAKFPFVMPRGIYLVHLKFANVQALAESNVHRQQVATGPGQGLPGAAWQDPAGRAHSFFEKLEAMPVIPWADAEQQAYDSISTDPVRDPPKGLVRARNVPIKVATDLPDWFKTA